MAFVLAVDAGTTGVRALALDETAAPCGRGDTGSSPSTSRDPAGWSTTPTEIADAVRATLAERRRRSSDGPVAAIGITNQRETVVAWDRRDRPAARTGPSCGRTGAPPTAAPSWPPPATSRSCAERTGLVLDPYFSATKMAWLLTEGGVRGRTRPGARHGRRVGGVAPDRRRGLRHRSLQRQPHDAVRHRPAGVERRAGGAVRRPGRRPARGAAVERPPRAHRRRLRRARRHPGRRHRRRPAGRPLRAGLLRAGHGQEHLRHRQLRPDERRARTCPAAGRGPAHHGGVGAGRRHAWPTPSKGRSS